MKTLPIITALILSCLAPFAPAAVVTFGDRVPFTLATTNIQTIDFEGIASPSNPFVSVNTAAGFTTAGVNFGGRSTQNGSYYLYVADQTAVSPDYDWGSGDSLLFESRGHLIATLPTGITALGFDFMAEDDAGSNTAGTSFTFTLSSGEVFTSLSLVRPNRAFFGVSSDQAITSIRIETTHEVRPPLPIIDNFSFGQTVPEPSTVGLLLFSGIAILVRRRKA
jgi:hypothetical protein